MSVVSFTPGPCPLPLDSIQEAEALTKGSTVDYLYRHRDQQGTAIALIVLHFVFLLTTIPAYLRTVATTQRNPGSVAFNDRRQAAEDQRRALPKAERRQQQNDIEAQATWSNIDQDPDSPGLESFYSKDMFVCEADGRPRWCALCWNWKPDRSHHSSQIGRCVRKMDHFCPWVGGMVAETCMSPLVRLISVVRTSADCF